jgi:hypothetical protein
MFKRLGVVTILVVLALMASVPAVSALGQISDTGVIWVDPLLYTPVQMPIPDISLPVAEAAHSAPAAPATVEPPARVSRGQALTTGSIRINPVLLSDGTSPDIHITFNVRGVNFIEADPEGYPYDHYEATGHLFWREGGEIDRVNMHLLEIWEHAPGLFCTYISGITHSGPRAGQQLCFMFCDNNYVLGAAWDGPPPYFSGTPVLSGNVTIKE